MITIIYKKDTGAIMAVVYPNQDSQGIFEQYANVEMITIPNELNIYRFERYKIDITTKTLVNI